MRQLRILVVEDNAVNRRLVRDVLHHRGHEILEAATVAEARAILQGSSVDLVLLDVQIPGGGGERLLAHIRTTPATAALPVVAVTALAMPGDRGRLLAAGFSGYISKPIDTRTFGPQIESFSERRG